MHNTDRKGKTEHAEVKERRCDWIGWMSYLYIPAAIIAALILSRCILIFGIIPTESMEPNYMTGSFFVGTRLLEAEDLSRGDAIIFHFGNEVYLKRVIGLPGDTVEISGGAVYINGEKLDESSYLPDGVETKAADGRTVFAVPKGSLFMMGDNRNNSYDSRYWPNPFISCEDVMGKMIVAVHL